MSGVESEPAKEMEREQRKSEREGWGGICEKRTNQLVQEEGYLTSM